MRLLKADRATPIDQVMGADVMAANPDLRGKTVGDAIGFYEQREGPSQGSSGYAGKEPAHYDLDYCGCWWCGPPPLGADYRGQQKFLVTPEFDVDPWQGVGQPIKLAK
jgi:hypothetical protein